VKRPDVPMGDSLLATQEPPRVDLPKESLDRIARLSLALTQAQIARARVVVTAGELVPYDERPDQARANMRAGVVRVIQALILLGYIDP
jgi:hypothetical protein